ncbi:hypothetical protein OS493_036805 [Desmophyllum pertusum]|uniref:Uncharacterized protein n=1 Tax=Desmophyllum pertusum TaxID=174260 RepID=A0A9W9ZVN3_9CNID|nr:hypothetical protein OS493_036805 [Desmophyllum pertusum]
MAEMCDPGAIGISEDSAPKARTSSLDIAFVSDGDVEQVEEKVAKTSSTSDSNWYGSGDDSTEASTLTAAFTTLHA